MKQKTEHNLNTKSGERFDSSLDETEKKYVHM